MNNILSNVLIKPHSEKETQYLQKYNMQLLRLKNGIQILGIPCNKDYTFYSHINFDFSEGAYGNKAGTVHFLEHFINKKLRRSAERNGLQVNAWTNQVEFGETLSGVTNPHVADYGIWQTLKDVRKALESPTSTVKNLEMTIETEKEVVKSEIKMRKASHDILVGEHRRKTVYAEENPLHDFPPVCGDEANVENINSNDLKQLQEKLFIPKNLLISYYYEGENSGFEKLPLELARLFEDFPRQKTSRNEIDKTLLGKINKNFHPNQTYSSKTELKNSLITTEYVWIIENKLPESPYLALRILKPFIASELFNYSRKKGWGYNTSVQVIRPNDQIAMVVLRVDCRKGKQKNYLPGIKHFLSKIAKDTTNFCELEKKRQEATPFTASDRLSWAVHGLKEYQNLIDADKIREFTLGIKPSDMNKIIHTLLSIEPAIITTGDLDIQP